MRVLLVAGLVALGVAALVVPLPWAVVEPGRLVPVGSGVTIAVDPALRAPDPSGEYLATPRRENAAALHLLLAAARPGVHIERGRRAAPDSVHPVVAATMAGLGIVPRYADIAELPVTASVSGEVDARALGTVLHAFDRGNQQDVARGRRIAGIGRMLDGGELVCTSGMAESVVAAAAHDVDVVVVPTDCADAAVAAVPVDARLEVVDAEMLAGAAQVLLAR